MANEREAKDHPGHLALGAGNARAAVFGFSDGLVSNVSLVIGFAAGFEAGGVDSSYVRLAGIAAAVAGAASMAAGEWVSVSAQNDLVARELKLEHRELLHNTAAETAELREIYRSHGMTPEVAQAAASDVMRDPDAALYVHAREEFGLDPTNLPNPVVVAVLSLLSFLAGAIIPVVPWFVVENGIVASLTLGVLAAAIVGGAIGRFANRSPLVTGARQVGILIAATGVTWLIGRLVGINLA